MRRRLIGWFLLIILITVVSMGYAINLTAGSTFRSFRGSHTQAHLSNLPHLLGHYYNLHGSWDGVDSEVSRLGDILSMRAVLVDTESTVLATTEIDPIGEKLTEIEWAEEIIPIMHPDLNVPVGTLLLTRSRDLYDADASFFDSLLRSSLFTALAVGVVGTLISILVAHSIVAPLTKMSEATELVTSGRYDVLVAEHDRDEIGRLGIAFNHMAKEIGKLEKVRRDMVINVSHDFRTPLTVIRGYLEALQSSKIADRRTAEVAFDRMMDEVTSLQGLIDGLNDVAALDSGEIPLELVTTDLGKLLKQSVDRVTWAAAEKKVQIDILIPPEPLMVDVDREKMGQVFFNLLDNAIHYSAEHGRIEVSAGRRANTTWITVQDNGEGIAPENIPYIFERFYRAGASQNRALDGYGMGLSIVKSITQRHQGDVQVESSGNYGEGATFKIVLKNHL